MILGPEHQLCSKSKAWSWSLSDDHYEIPFSLCHNIPLSQNEYSWVTNTIGIRWCSLWIKRFLIPLYVISREPTYLTFSWFMFNLWQSTGVYSSQKAMYDKLWDVPLSGFRLSSYIVTLPFLVADSQRKFEVIQIPKHMYPAIFQIFLGCPNPLLKIWRSDVAPVDPQDSQTLDHKVWLW